MGQTLTHGIYLPDEGERNCYDGLASNWQLLDGAVGTVAEHTTQIAGKAPAVHTHTKSDITDFPAYGNAAGTICEGNDSRLSDARTPVAHTHTKSDVTDLLNSNFIPSANNSYNLGSSSYQWNNLYAKNYYYNGTAWGLDKANVWSANNEYKYLIGLSGAEIWFKHPNIEDITSNPDANIGKSIIQIYNKAVTQYFGGISDNLRTDGTHRLTISCFGFPLNSYAGYYPHAFYFEAKRDGTASFSPSYTNASLGTSTNKWKTLNGTNPGALSLPDYDSDAKLNFTSTFPTPDSHNIISYIPTMSGWLYVYFNVANATTSADFFYAEIKDNNMNNANAAQVFWRSKPAQDLPVFFPVIANKTFRIEINFTGYTVVKALLIPSIGHVA